MRKHDLTIPNLLSCVRLLLIPVLVWLYLVKAAYGMAFLVLLLSAATDIADGIIARKWDQISDLGKVLDPVADKLTQVAALACLVSRFPYMWLPLAILTGKELLTGAVSLYAVKRSGQVLGADWHGKVCTGLLYGVMGLHILWSGIPAALSKGLLGLCMAQMCLSGVLYGLRNHRQIRQGRAW